MANCALVALSKGFWGMLTIIFGSVLLIFTIYCWRAPDLAIPNTMTVFWGVWLVSLFAVFVSPTYPVVTVALVDTLAGLFMVWRARADLWQIFIAILFASQLLCHIAFWSNVVVYETTPNLSPYLDLLTVLFYLQIFTVAGTKWLNGDRGKELGEHHMAARFGRAILNARVWDTEAHKGSKA